MLSKPSFKTDPHCRAPFPASWLAGTSSDPSVMPTYLTTLMIWMTAKLLEQREGATKTVPEQAHLYVVDSRLLHLWEAKEGLARRLQRQKHNRPLCRRLAKLNQDISRHATDLTTQHWNALCDRMEGNMNVP
ncbi:hypothetical protein HPB48_009686 [Haemaphysalis longicornis]|uniref:Uncharacterized protein n=1 Tax=Haemaphysalis longicornis TaxID=44386 RepID=A0A9J6FQP1_HAELO|nr:hypothetical protein HPB48_009686 [Haemaphysalis longicornis]